MTKMAHTNSNGRLHEKISKKTCFCFIASSAASTAVLPTLSGRFDHCDGSIAGVGASKRVTEAHDPAP
jgi:hypothetical protein